MDDDQFHGRKYMHGNLIGPSFFKLVGQYGEANANSGANALSTAAKIMLPDRPKQ
jgi:hypothetical protein